MFEPALPFSFSIVDGSNGCCSTSACCKLDLTPSISQDGSGASSKCRDHCSGGPNMLQSLLTSSNSSTTGPWLFNSSNTLFATPHGISAKNLNPLVNGDTSSSVS